MQLNPAADELQPATALALKQRKQGSESVETASQPPAVTLTQTGPILRSTRILAGCTERLTCEV